MRRRAFTSVALSLAVIAVGVAACGLDRSGLEAMPVDSGSMPSSTPVGDATASLADGNGASPGSDGAGGGPGGDATVSGDGAAPGDATLPDGAQPPDANPPDVGQPDVHILDPDASYEDSGDSCDLDQDGYKSMEDGCGGTDCCDYDSRANPGDTNYYATADACGSFDYNCNGTSEPLYPKVNCTLGILSCSGDGFDQTPPACGVSATYDTCTLGFFTCNTSQSPTAQECR